MTIVAPDQYFFRIRGQVAGLLLERAGDGTGGQRLLAQRDIAAALGTGWDMVHLSLKSLYEEGAIRIERNRIIIKKELLQKAAGAAGHKKS